MSRRLLALCSLLLWGVETVSAQDSVRNANARALFVNEEWERYVRVLQLAGDVDLSPWSIRSFGPAELRALRIRTASHPWAGETAGSQWQVGRISIVALPAIASTIYNSRFPFGFNDGPVWVGRGLTAVVSGGLSARAGPLTAIVAPTAFRAENTRFPLRPNGMSGHFAYGDAFLPGSIDQPQRFGEGAYQRLHPGNSTVRLDVRGASLGFSTANQHWGPARDHPLVLGNNAPGFPHVFLSSSRPIDLKILRAHGRVMWGKLYQSRYTMAGDTQPYRFATGIVAVVMPKRLPGLELGAARFFHVQWSDNVLTQANLTRALTGLLKQSRADAGNPLGNEPDNQLASVFGRWVLALSGFEVYGEFAREDHSWDLRDLELEPDHMAGYMVGMQRTWARGPTDRFVVRGELLNTRLSPLHLVREQAPFYSHAFVPQGHTNEGQVLGSVAAFGGGAFVLALDRYTSRGRWTVTWSRLMRAEAFKPPHGMPDPDGADVAHALGIDGLLFRGGDNVGLTYEVTGVREFNRDFGGDAFNIRAATGLRVSW